MVIREVTPAEIVLLVMICVVIRYNVVVCQVLACLPNMLLHAVLIELLLLLQILGDVACLVVVASFDTTMSTSAAATVSSSSAMSAAIT